MNTKCYCGHTATCDCEPQKILEDNIKQFENCIKNLDESFAKQKTLEEAILRIKSENEHYIDEVAFELGAKWQQERSYSEEEVKNLIKIIKWYDEYSDVRPNVVISEDEQINGIAMWEWFEQFKKK